MAISSRTWKGPKAEVVYYALGGGLGHLTRGVAIARQYKKLRSAPIVLLTNSTHTALAERESIPCLHIGAGDSTTSESLGQQVARRLHALSPKVIVMDTFPRGVLGEMTTMRVHGRVKRILIKRHLNPRYARSKDVIQFVNLNFDRAILCEPQPELDSQIRVPATSIPPVVIRSHDELLPREDARCLLGCRGEEFVILGVGSGSEEQTRRLFKLLCKIVAQLSRRGVCQNGKSGRGATRGPLRLRLSSLGPLREPEWEACRVDHYPLVELMRGVDLIVGASGYNLFYETLCAGVDAVFVPQSRQYDDQFLRAGDKAASAPEELRRMIAERWVGLRATPTTPSFRNGAVEAAKLIADVARDA